MIVTFILAVCASGCAPVPPAEPIAAACTATDGDTIRCDEERIRLLGIDAPELAGHCREGRACAPGNPEAAREALAAGLQLGPLAIRRTGKDRYGRTLGAVLAGDVDLACRQLELGTAIYRRDWDDRRLVGRACPELAR